MNEVFESYPPDKKTFLLKSSYLKRCGKICANAVTGVDNAKQILFDMSRRNEFVVFLGEEDGIYRLHPILKEFLFKKAESNRFATYCRPVCQSGAMVPHVRIAPAGMYSTICSGMQYPQAFELIEIKLGNFASKNEYATAHCWIEHLTRIL
jgi:hypothetical protein